MIIFVVTPIAAFLLALAFYPFTNLFLPACFSSVTPEILIAGAVYASRSMGFSPSPFNGARRAVVVSTIITIAGGYTAGIYELLARPRSNARELMRAVSTEQRADDLVIIAPGWLVSSVNHYGGGSANQIAYPDSGGTRLFDFFDTAKRMRDDAALARAREAINEFAATGRRVWLVTDRSSARGATRLDRASGPNMKAVVRIARVRVEDLRHILSATFGAPVSTEWPMRGVPLQEDMLAELYGPMHR